MESGRRQMEIARLVEGEGLSVAMIDTMIGWIQRDDRSSILAADERR